MDLVCPTCGEYWDFDSLHEEAQERYGIPYYVYENEYSTLGLVRRLFSTRKVEALKELSKLVLDATNALSLIAKL